MTLILDSPAEARIQTSAGFEQLDEAYSRLNLSDHDLRPFGSYALGQTVILPTPESICRPGEILTNPSQVIREPSGISIDSATVDFAYFRKEPLIDHLGKTTAVPLIISKDPSGSYSLSEHPTAAVLEGEDPRVMRNIRIKSGTGKVHTGWCISTVIATPDLRPGSNDATIKQVFYWGETLTNMEPVAEIDDLKNTCPYPASSDGEDTSLYVFGRPHPHISFGKVADITKITKTGIESDQRITQDFLTEGIRCGVNYIKGNANKKYLELDVHEASQPMVDGKKVLHYRLVRYGFELKSRRLIPLGVYAVRNQFPDALPKPPDSSVGDYSDILYGSLGDPDIGYMLTGLADRHIGLAQILPT